MGMDLLQNIRSDRARQRRKQPCKRAIFNTVSGIVKEYGLDENFLELIDKTEEDPSRVSMQFEAVKAKKVFEFPPFSLVSKEQYRLVVTIAGKLDNPYLQFAHSPEEMLWSAPLYEANPSLRREELLRRDFATLLQCQRAKEELAELVEQSGNSTEAVDQGKEMEEYGGLRTHPGYLQERIKQLQTFIETVENMEF